MLRYVHACMLTKYINAYTNTQQKVVAGIACQALHYCMAKKTNQPIQPWYPLAFKYSMNRCYAKPRNEPGKLYN